MSKKASFDHTVHVRDPKSGQIVRTNPYRRFVKRGQDGTAIVTYERDKVLYHEDGSLVPVVVATATEEKPAEKKAQARAAS